MLKKLGILFLVAAMLLGCASSKHGKDASKDASQDQSKQARQDAPPEQLQPVQAAQPVVDPVVKRQMQTRVFDTADEKMMLSTSAAVLKDLGFTLGEDHPELGFLTGVDDKMSESSKKAAGLRVGAAVLGNFGVFGALVALPMAMASEANGTQGRETTSAMLVTTRIGDGRRLMVRLSMQRVIYNDNGTLAMANVAADPKVYQDFFDKLAKATTLEAHAL